MSWKRHGFCILGAVALMVCTSVLMADSRPVARNASEHQANAGAALEAATTAPELTPSQQQQAFTSELAGQAPAQGVKQPVVKPADKVSPSPAPVRLAPRNMMPAVQEVPVVAQQQMLESVNPVDTAGVAAQAKLEQAKKDGTLGGPGSRACEDCLTPNTDLGDIGSDVWGYSVTADCSVEGKWYASFNGYAFTTYYFDTCDQGSASSDLDIKICDADCNILAGVDGNSACNYNPDDFAWTCDTDGTYYVVLAPYNSYSSHTCGGDATDTFTMAYYATGGSDPCEGIDPPVNDECADAVPVVQADFGTVITGTCFCATADCPGVLDWNGVWYEIELPYAENQLDVAYCGLTEDLTNVGIVVVPDCTCTTYTLRDVGAFAACASTGFQGYSMTWNNLPGPGTILLPALVEGGPDPFYGIDYEMVVNVTEYVPSYCEPCYSDLDDEIITNVTFNTINNETVAEGAPCSYGDYTGLSTEVAQSLTYDLMVTFDSGTYVECVQAWFDWNQDLVFNATDEYYYFGQYATGTYTLPIEIPLYALLGETRMRVIVDYSTCDDVCATTSYGECEDYAVIIGPPPAFGACCDGAACTPDQTEADCTAGGGIYIGDGTDCDPNPCVGACCDGEVCTIELEEDCLGIFQGGGTTCDPNPCVGACCHFPSGDCTVGTEDACAAAGDGTYYGDGTVCEGLVCPTPGDTCEAPMLVDAIPYANTNTTCGRGNNYQDVVAEPCLGYYDSGEDMIYEITITEAMCLDFVLTSDTTYTGMALDTECPPDDVCVAVGTSSATGAEMLGVMVEPGIYYLQVDTWASPTCINLFDLTIEPCPTGACCVGQDCYIESDGDCVAMGGVYQGDDTTCDPNPCLMGACCTDTGCETWTEADCVAAGFTYMGDGVPCDPDPCPLLNDNCADALEAFDGLTPYDTTNATTDGPAHAECQFDGQTYNDIWFYYYATCTGDLTVSMCQEDGGDSMYDTDLVVYDGCDCENLVLLGCNDDAADTCTASGSSYASRVIVPVVAGNCYLIRPGGYSDGTVGTATMSISCAEYPQGACCIDGVCDIDYQPTCELAGGFYGGDDSVCPGIDCQPNGYDDLCDLLDGTSEDCNGNGIPDECDIAGGAPDCDGNGVPDECDPDCNENGIIDACDVDCSLADCMTCYPECVDLCDCQGDGVPDECQLGGGGGKGSCDICIHDDGSSEDGLGLTAGGEMAWIQHCEGAGTIGAVCTVWGYLGGSAGVNPGDAVRVYVWDDPNGDGDPADAVFLAEGNGFADAGSIATDVFQEIAVGPVAVGESYFIGASAVHAAGGYPAAMDQTAPVDEAWLGYVGVGAYDPVYPGGDEAVPLNMTAIGYACNWLIHASAGSGSGAGDCNENGIPDECEVDPLCMAGDPCFPAECAEDCQPDLVPDECQMEDNDCQPNGIPDDCDIAAGSYDCQPDGIPDECQLVDNDCNGDLIPDDCQLEDNDCQPDGIPDDCQLDPDCDGNGIPDECDEDCDNNGIIDFCDTSCDANCVACYGGDCGQACDCNGNSIPDDCELGAKDRAPTDLAWGADEGSGDVVVWFQLDTPGTLTSVGTHGSANFLGAGDFGPDGFDYMYIEDGGVLSKMFMSDGHLEVVGSMGGADLAGMAWDASRGVMFGSDTDITASNLYTINLATGTTTLVGAMGTPGAIALAVDCEGNLYSFDIVNDDFGSVNADTGAYTTIGPLGFTANYGQGLDFDDDDGTCYMAAFNADSFQAELRAVDVTTGASTLVGALGTPGTSQLGFLGVATSCGSGADCNGNGIPDECDVAPMCDAGQPCYPAECSLDCNEDAVPDECQLEGNDCNENGIPDDCDIASGFSEDCNENGVPDDCDIAAGTSLDCNGNLIPDECDIASGFSQDCNGNGIPDECDLASGFSCDCQGDDIPDECQLDAKGRACDLMVYDNGVCDGVNGTSPTAGWANNGLVADLTVPQGGNPMMFSCWHMEILAFEQADMPEMRLRIYALPTGSILTDLPSFAAATPLFDYTYTVASGELVITDREECYPGALAWDYDGSGPSYTFDPGSYAAFVNFPGFAGTNYWASAPAIGDDSYVWGVDVDAPSAATMDLAFNLTGGEGVAPANDCNENGIPDECDTVLCEAGEPCFPDECARDCDENGIPDECEFVCGDLDDDTDVDVDDFNLFIDAFGYCDPHIKYQYEADLDCDGCITLIDYGLWLECYHAYTP